MTGDSTVGKRLSRYIGDGPEARMSVRAFAQAMYARKPKPRGSARAMIHRYLAGAKPPTDFIAAAADVLQIRPEWLAFGTEDPTGGHAEVSRISSEAIEQAEGSPEWKRALQLKLGVLEGLGIPAPDLSPVPADDTVRVMDAWATATNVSHIPHWVPPLAELRRRLGIEPKEIGRALRGPLDALGIDPTEGVDSSYRTLPWLDDYITAMTPVLLPLASRLEEKEEDSDE